MFGVSRESWRAKERDGEGRKWKPERARPTVEAEGRVCGRKRKVDCAVGVLGISRIWSGWVQTYVS